MNKYKVGDRVYYYGEKMRILSIGTRFYDCLDSENCVRFILKTSVKPIITVQP